MRKKIVCVLASAGVILLALGLLQRLLMPKYMSDVTEGALIAEYYGEPKNHNVIFFGDCEVYENFSPAVLWEDYGINSYIRGSAQQLIWQSYYLMEETFRYEKPDVVVFNVLSMKYNEPQKEAYNRMTLDGMKWSAAKAKSINASMTEEENFLDYVFPILRYHSRWNELTGEDIKYFWKPDPVSYNGYYMRVDALPAENVPEGKPLMDYAFGDNAYAYLDKMVKLCEENDVKLVLIKAPSLIPYWYPQWEEQIEDYAKEHDLPYYNFLENIEEIGLDFTTDTYDGGLHLNLYGAEKMSRYFGKILSQECGVENLKEDSVIAGQWKGKLEVYEKAIADKKEELGL